MDKEAVLSQISLFENISTENRASLADICIPKNVRKKETLFWEGDKGVSVYILVKGTIQLYKSTPEGKEVVIKIIKPGEMFAEVILFERSSYPVSAVALQDSLVFLISRHQFACLLENEAFRNDFISNLMSKMRYLADQIRYLTHHDVEERLFMFLKEQHGEKTRIRVAISKKDVAAAIGATPETLSRLLQRLKREKKLIWEGSEISIPAEVWGEWKDG